jgi:hypothetical protein
MICMSGAGTYRRAGRADYFQEEIQEAPLVFG